MAASGGDHDPGGVQRGPLHRAEQQTSYANRLKTNVSYNARLKRNILEITVEKTEREAEVNINDVCVERIVKSIGMDIMSQVEGYQVMYDGRTSMIKVWATKGLDLERFCKVEGIKIGKGVVTGQIRPAGRKDVTLTAIGLDFNTPDSLIFEYIQKFGAVIINNTVIYSKFSEGPFKGKYNGERKYQVDFTNCKMNMGTYHFLDGAKVRIFYHGNVKTCGRCHGTPEACPGRGIARDCQEAAGPRTHLNDHMRKIWSEIGFNPTSFELPNGKEIDETYDNPIAESDHFRKMEQAAAVTEEDTQRYVGMSIANFSLEVSDNDIKQFVQEFVSKDIEEETISIVREKKKAVVTINYSLTSEIIKDAMTKINFSDCKEKFFGKPLYCRPLRDITPEKTSTTGTPQPANSERTEMGARTREPVKKIPGLPPGAQAKALTRQLARDKKENEKKKEKPNEDVIKNIPENEQSVMEEPHKLQEKFNANLNAFDILMRPPQLQGNMLDPRDEMIPAFCSPGPLKSKFGQDLNNEVRRLSVGSMSAYKLTNKRGSDQLSSPSSPPNSTEVKKNKSEKKVKSPQK